MIDINNKSRDADIEQIKATLDAYRDSHPNSRIDVHRQNLASIRIRIIDPDFKGMDWMDREPEVWKLLDVLPDDVYTSITMLVLVTPKEAKRSGASLEFEDPVHTEF